MEQFILDRLELRRKRLEEHLKGAEQLLLQCKSEATVLEQDVVKWHISLKQSVNNIQSELDQCVNRGIIDKDPLELALQQQMKGEELLLELELIIKLHPTTTSYNMTTVKLPKLELPKFDGCILKWTEFWDRFNTSVHSQNLKDVEKLAYLLSSLEGKAKDTLEGLSMTTSNYQVAIETLTTRYGHTSKVIDSHYEALAKLERCEYTAEGCRRNLNEIETHLRVLTSLGENKENNHLRGLIMGKFPEKVIYELNLLTPHDQSVSAIRTTIDTIIRALEQAQIHNDPIAIPSTSTEAFHAVVEKPIYRQGKRVLRKPFNKPNSVDTVSRKRKGAGVKDVTTKRTRRLCVFCNGDHYNDECTKVTDLQERKKKLRNKCYKCLKTGHRENKCFTKGLCIHCNGTHNRALCPKRTPPGNTLACDIPTINSTSQCLKTKSFLQTAMAQVVHNNKIVKCRLLLDSGSQRSYITTGLAKHLDLTSDNMDSLLIFTFGAEKPTETLSPCSDITIRTKRGIERRIHVNIVPRITDKIPKPSIPRTNLVDVLADSGSTEDQAVDMLIGNDYYFSFIKNNTIQIDNDLFLVDTDFGWVISGHLNVEKQGKENILAVITYHQSNLECACYTEPDLPLRQSDIKFLWSLENLGITDSAKATREEDAVQHFNDTVVYHEGRYYVKWPWTTYPPQVPTNYGLAYGRLKGLLQRLDGPTLQEYNEILMEQLKNEIIEVVQADTEFHCQSIPPVHYLPHHIIKQSGKRGRVVYDASARVKEQQSLNECLYRGPCMLQDLTALLLNFRLYKIGIIADVEKAFLQIGLQEEDREVTRFLWLKDINKPISNENVLHLRFCRVPFGIVSSPFLLTATIRYHISQKDTELLKNVANKCYVDNLVTGTNNMKDAVQLFEETKTAFEELSMNLRDWTSNDESFIQKIPEPYRAKETNEIKVLGLLWNKNEDVLTLKMNKEVLNKDISEKVTKRKVLRTLASIYDPCGIVSPALMPVKLFLQELWRKQYKWDSPVSQELLHKWKKIKNSLSEIDKVKIPRYVESDVNDRTENELHCFTDAAKDSYAAVAYLRSSDGSKVKISFLMSKTRIAPLEKERKSKNSDIKKQEKKLTIPQLELLGCVIGNRLLTYLKNNIELPITRQYLWTDSQIVLGWIHSNKLLPPFIANRIDEIKRNAEVQAGYVNTKENPADIATRPELWPQKKNEWLRGPTFLLKNKDKWPKDTYRRCPQELASLSAEAEGLKEHSSDNMIPVELATDGEPKPTKSQVSSQVQDIKYLQQTFFPEETKGKQTNLSRNLGLFSDVDGLLRCKGRMTHANWSYDMKYPILLPRDCEFTKKAVKEIHEKNYHVGPSHTLNLVRQQFWIPKGRPVVERILRKCPQCVKHGGGPYPLPPTPALPVERANYSTPFTYTGIDYFGPVYVDTENGHQKRWVCLLTCLAVRAIHMEVVKNLTAEECIMALKRFMAVRGVPVAIVSDNALYFKLSSEILNSKHSIGNNVEWRFIPQLAPWHGAFYERLVGLVKHSMKRTLEKGLLNDTQILTVIKEIEAVVNSRPLTRIGPDMEVVLRPCDFLSLGNCLNLEMTKDFRTEGGDTLVKHKLIESWKRGQNMLNQFKNMFINQYLMSLRERYQHSHKQPRVKSHKKPSIGDLVQIKGESQNRVNWRVGKIVQLIRSSDGHYRVARVQVGDKIFTRSIGHLYPLELEEPLSPQVETIEVRKSPSRVQDSIHNEPHIIQILESPPEIEEAERLKERRESSEIVPDGRTEEERESDDEISKRRDCVLSEPPIQEMPIETPDPLDIDIHEVGETDTQGVGYPREEVVRRTAAIRAREKIAEWTRQLFANF